MTHIHHLRREQVIPTDLETAWHFIASPENLDRITPPDMGFEVMSELPETIFDGLLIEYRIAVPILGKQSWLTEIQYIREGRAFVDEQRIGPYKFWMHLHEIEACEGGVRFRDRVTYALPFGPIGTLAHALYVKKQLRRVFDYRARVLPECLGAAKP